MAVVSINLSQATANTITAQSVGGAVDVAENIGVFFLGEYNFGISHPSYSSQTSTANSLRLSYSDGATTLLSGMVFDNPGATTGLAKVAAREELLPSYYRLSLGGSLDYYYDNSSGQPSIEARGGTITSAALQTLLPTTNSLYDPVIGNATVSLQGAITLAGDSSFSGVVNTLVSKSDYFLTSSVMSGVLNVSGNGNAIGQDLGTVQLSGVVDTLDSRYADGSKIVVTGLGLNVTGTSVLDERVFGDAANFSSNDTIDVVMPATLGSAWRIAAGGGDDVIALRGGGTQLSVDAGSGNDRITLGDHNHLVDGGTGLDTLVVAGARDSYKVLKDVQGYTLSANGGGSDTLLNIERIKFDDVSVAFDIYGTGGQAYRIYQAAFNRTPDKAGLGYWIDAMDRGMSLQAVSENFVNSKEFRDIYGSDPSNADVLQRFYANVLHREPDAAGYAYWLDIMNTKQSTNAQVLAQFGESAENQAALVGVLLGGFAYTPWG